MQKLIIGIDDTDNADSKGTGSIATEMCELIENNNWGTCAFVTRHQLFLHPDVPYTSHNSSMIFEAEVHEDQVQELEGVLSAYLRQESAPGSDPGICIAKIPQLLCKEKLIEFGYNAKRLVLTKEMAYDLAKECGVFLKEEGGTGLGVIGALAGVGLRYDGNDGEIKGGLDQYTKGQVVLVRDLLQEDVIERVCNKNMEPIDESTQITVKWKVKPILHGGIATLLVEQNEKGKWITLSKEELRTFGDARADVSACELFTSDVAEELVNEEEFLGSGTASDADSCFNCRYRRWTQNSFSCMKGKR